MIMSLRALNDKGQRKEGLTNDMNEDEDDGVQSTSKDSMLKETSRQLGKKEYKRARTFENCADKGEKETVLKTTMKWKGLLLPIQLKISLPPLSL